MNPTPPDDPLPVVGAPLQVVRLLGDDPRLADCFAIRHVVFVVEQAVPEDLEVDGLDGACVHFLALVGGRAVGAARLRVPDPEWGKAERVAVLAELRGAGVGRRLMEALEAEAAARGLSEVHLSAQEQAISFYIGLGYVGVGEPFEEAGIPHLSMVKALA